MFASQNDVMLRINDVGCAQRCLLRKTMLPAANGAIPPSRLRRATSLYTREALVRRGTKALCRQGHSPGTATGGFGGCGGKLSIIHYQLSIFWGVVWKKSGNIFCGTYNCAHSKDSLLPPFSGKILLFCLFCTYSFRRCWAVFAKITN